MKSGVKSKRLNLVEGVTELDDGASPRINLRKLRKCVEDFQRFFGLEPVEGEVAEHEWANTARAVKTPEWRLYFSSLVSRLIDLEKGR